MSSCGVVIGKMTCSETSPGRVRSLPWSELTRRCSQKRHLLKRYWCFWIVAALCPFTLLRMVYLSNVKSMMESEERMPHRNPNIISIKSPVVRYPDGKSSTSYQSPLSRADSASRITLHERISIETSQPRKHRKKIRKMRKRKASKSKERQPSGQSVETQAVEGYLGFPDENQKFASAALVVAEKQKDSPIGEYLNPKGDIATVEENVWKVRTFKEKPGAGHSSGTQDEGYLGLPEDNDKIDSIASVMAETQQVEEVEKLQEEEKDVPIGEQQIPARNIAAAEERHDREAEAHWTGTEVAPPSEEERLARNESEEVGPVEQKQTEEQNGANERSEAEMRESNEHKPMEMTEAEQKWNDDRREDEQEESVAERETQRRIDEQEEAVAERETQRQIDEQEEAVPERETEKWKEDEALKNVEAIEERREEEEVKDAEGIEREMIEEKYQATEKEKEEQKHEDGVSVIHEVTDNTQSKEPEEQRLAGQCDLFEGDWEWDPEGPLYTNATCFYMQGAQNCMSNGRPDTDYLHWKWKPRDCDLPRFDARAFLEAFKGKTIGFVGDSLARNQMQSLLCMLSQIEVPRLVYQSHDDATVRWLYEQHQVTLASVWSPYLLKESSEGIMGFDKGQSVLYLDILDTEWTSVMQDFDIIVLSIGQWYFKGSVYVRQDEVVGCHCCPGHNLTSIAYHEAYQGAVRKVLGKVASEFKGIAIMSTFAISHFEDGPWENGGQCRREKPLNKEEGANFPGVHNEMHDIVMSEFNSIAYDKSKLNEDVKLEFLDVTKVSLTRADGHPGPYRRANPYEGRSPDEWVPNDCLHWCLPGPVDTWNQLLVKLAHRHL